MILSLLGPGRVWATLDADGQLWAAALATGASDWAWEARQSARIASTIHCARPMPMERGAVRRNWWLLVSASRTIFTLFFHSLWAVTAVLSAQTGGAEQAARRDPPSIGATPRERGLRHARFWRAGVAASWGGSRR